MAGKETISPKQATAFVIAGGVGIIFFWITEVSIHTAGRDAWISFIIGYSLSVLVALSLIALNKRFPGKNLVQYVPLIIGRPLGFVYVLIYVVTFTYFTALILNLSINMVSLFYEETPGIAFTAVSVVLLAYVCKQGIEVFARVCELFIPLILLSIFFLIGAVSPQIEIGQLRPVFEKGVMPILQLVPQTLSFAGEYIIFMALWLPLLNQNKKAFRSVVIGTSISAFVLVLVLVTVLAVFGEDYAQKLAFSTIKLTLLAVLPGIEGLPSLTLGVWIIAAFIKGAVFFFPSVVGLGQLFHLKDYRPLVWPMALIVTALSLLPDNYFSSLRENQTLGLYFCLPLTLSLPVLLLIAKVRNLKEG